MRHADRKAKRNQEPGGDPEKRRTEGGTARGSARPEGTRGLSLNLRLFDGEAAGPGAEGAASGAAAPARDEAAPTRTGGSNSLANVRYGKQPDAEAGGKEGPPAADGGAGAPRSADGAGRDAQAPGAPGDTARDRGAAFEELIQGEYAEEFRQRTQRMIDSRFQQAKQLEQRQEALKPVLDALSSRYGLDLSDPKDFERLKAAMDEDDSYYEEEAGRKGLPVAQLKQLKRMERENAELRQAVEERERRDKADQAYAGWMREGERLRQAYPGFDLGAEVSDAETGPRFLALLQNGVDMRTAYEVIHKDDLLSGAIGYAVSAAQRRTMDSIRARGMRPAENGTGACAAARLVKSDPAAWSKADQREVTRRVLAGERIEL